jgi:phosphoserine phosphatase
LGVLILGLMVKAVLLDFDGTLVSKDILDVVCGIVGKEAESERINAEYHAGKRAGLSALVERINFLQGVSESQIKEKLKVEPYLLPGAQELMVYLNKAGIVSILNSGNLLPVLKAYQEMLGISRIVGSSPVMRGEVIVGISEQDFPGPGFKLEGVKTILDELGIAAENTVAIGDSPADKAVFEFAGTAIAINPKGGVEAAADYVIGNLTEAVPIIQRNL